MNTSSATAAEQQTQSHQRVVPPAYVGWVNLASPGAVRHLNEFNFTVDQIGTVRIHYNSCTPNAFPGRPDQSMDVINAGVGFPTMDAG